MHFIESEVTKLKKKYKTLDPFVICYEKGIECKLLNLHYEIKGIYQYIERNKYIYINSQLSTEEQLYICYHELAHAVLHEKHNCNFLKTCTGFNLNKFEKEAEIFVACFLVPDVEKVLNYESLTLEEISCELSVPKEYVQLRMDYHRNCSLS